MCFSLFSIKVALPSEVETPFMGEIGAHHAAYFEEKKNEKKKTSNEVSLFY